MPVDLREESARYYDLQPMRFDDVPFYLAQLPSPETRVLELGCGTGRVLIPLAAHCRRIVGVDASEAMLAVCRAKLQTAGLPEDKAHILLGDITDLDLGESFDYIIAPCPLPTGSSTPSSAWAGRCHTSRSRKAAGRPSASWRAWRGPAASSA